MDDVLMLLENRVVIDVKIWKAPCVFILLRARVYLPLRACVFPS
jgi:hypothetical protein